jgi:hypothetical protein
VQLVTPVKIATNFGTGAVMPIFGILTLHFVPEPSTILLFGAGVAAFGMLGRRHTRK